MLENISRGLIGIVVLLGICLLLSSNRKAINWRLIIGGIILQVTIAILILKTPFALVITWLSGAFIKLVGFTEAGSGMLFGELLDTSKFGLAFNVLPTIIFVSALTSVLYYYGILQRIVFGFAWIMKRLMRLSGAESLAAAANVFIGQTEAPLVVKPYISKMTRSELMALMTGGMATIAGSVFLIYVKLEVGRQLLTASMMNAPAALLIAKLLVPETEEIDENIEVPRDKQGVNVLDALANGTTEGLKLMLNVGAMLLVFFAVIAMINWGFGWVGGGGVFESFSLQAVIGFVFAPLGWVIGGESGDILQIGQLLGTKMVATEFVAYQELGEMTSSLSPKSVFLATFALCGFANFGSIGIQLGGIGALAPERRSTLAKLGVKAMIGGTLASLLTASIAGIFF
ncbi:UNVERIFIED_CONTAM: hypothetical protein GTU68_016507 [Idotea baltica]|nr:hypothetical protein [Idotea baltica]